MRQVVKISKKSPKRSKFEYFPFSSLLDEVDTFDHTIGSNQGHKRQKSIASSVFFQSLKNKSMSIGNLSMLKGKKDKKFRLGRKKGKKEGTSVKIDVVKQHIIHHCVC